MGNKIGKVSLCFTGTGTTPSRKHNIYNISDPSFDEGLGHSFCYVRPETHLTRPDHTTRPVSSSSSSSKVHSESVDPTTASSSSSVSVFRTISGASVSANTTTTVDPTASGSAVPVSSAAFESSTSFASIPLQPIPKHINVNNYSGPINTFSGGGGPIGDRFFMSGPIERGFLSGPLDRGPFSGPLQKASAADSSSSSSAFMMRSVSHTGWSRGLRRGTRKPRELIRTLRKAISRKLNVGHSSIVAPASKDPDTWIVGGSLDNKKNDNSYELVSYDDNGIFDHDDEEVDLFRSGNLQWAQGKAGEDRVHVVVSEEHGWVFVGIYDGFNGPDATDFLLSNLYPAVHKELKGLLWDDGVVEYSSGSNGITSCERSSGSSHSSSELKRSVDSVSADQRSRMCRQCSDQENYPSVSGDEGFVDSRRKRSRDNSRSRYDQWDRERIELDRRIKEQVRRQGGDLTKDEFESDVLSALSRALRKTEESYLDIADKMLVENPELNLMGSCVLVMLMKGEDVYVMNVGDSCAVLAQKADTRKIDHDLERISEETFYDPEAVSRGAKRSNLNAFQLSSDHSTSIHEEVQRIRREHRDDAYAVMNDRVKGSLKVTRAFGAGFLKQPKWNDALLEMFRIDYIGDSPYINCEPCLRHHRLGPRDRFLILSSDGLYQYFTNEEAVSEVELFISTSPDGDPAQHLVEELLFRAAKKAGMDFYELLEIPQGDRRRYHDDVSIIVISFEGRIWRSSV
ncbi:putative protein phosphatase 2C 4 [Drosera capensis]